MQVSCEWHFRHFWFPFSCNVMLYIYLFGNKCCKTCGEISRLCDVILCIVVARYQYFRGICNLFYPETGDSSFLWNVSTHYYITLQKTIHNLDSVCYDNYSFTMEIENVVAVNQYEFQVCTHFLVLLFCFHLLGIDKQVWVQIMEVNARV
jgi:hypothetical protein